jgi:hypothetical protein
MMAIETIPNSYSVETIRRGTYTFDTNIYENSIFKMYMIFPTKYLSRYNKVSELCQLYNQDGDLDIQDMFRIYSDTQISRRFTMTDPMEVGTVSYFFVDDKNNVYFCLGNPLDSSLGILTTLG